MKSFFTLVLMFLYLIPAIGVSISVHYCGAKIYSVVIGTDESEKCVCGSKKMKMNCCRDKIVTLQLSDDHQQATGYSLNTAKSFYFQPAQIVQNNFHCSTVFVESALHNSKHPPDDIKSSLHILNRVFRI